MNRKSKIIAVILLTFLFTSSAFAGKPPIQCVRTGEWITVDSWKIDGAALANAMTIAGSNIWVAGTASKQGDTYWAVRYSADQGETWRTVDLFELVEGKTSAAHGAASSPLGSVFFAGLALDEKNNFTWIVRKLSINGEFKTVRKFNQDGLSASASAVAVDGEGLVYVSGMRNDADNKTHWVTERSDDDGSTWKIVDDFTVTDAYPQPNAMAVGPDNQVYVAGMVAGKAIVRKGSGHGTWTTIRSYAPDATHFAGYWNIEVGLDGTVLVAGSEEDLDDQGMKWIVQKSHDSSLGVWKEIDKYFIDLDKMAEAGAVAYDEDSTEVFAGGYADNATSRKWVVRAGTLQSSFKNSDVISVTTAGSPPIHGVTSLKIDFSKRLFAAGSLTADDHPQKWVVRRMTCEE